MYRTGALLGVLFAALLTLTACSPRAGSGGTAPNGPTPWITPQGPGGEGGRLLGARWQVDRLTVGGRRISGPPHARAWADFGYDDTVLGDDGCTPFKTSARITATTVTVGEGTAQATPDGTCPAEYRAFQERLRKTLAGSLAVTAGAGESSLTLTNQRGDTIGLRLLWPAGLFETPWHLQYLLITDGDVPMDAEKQVVYYVFHRDGTVTGNAGCNDFTGRAAFGDKSVTLYPLTRTTHRPCSPKILADESYVLDQKPRTFTVVFARFGDRLEFGDRSDPVAYFGYHFVRLAGTPPIPGS